MICPDTASHNYKRSLVLTPCQTSYHTITGSLCEIRVKWLCLGQPFTEATEFWIEMHCCFVIDYTRDIISNGGIDLIPYLLATPPPPCNGEVLLWEEKVERITT